MTRDAETRVLQLIPDLGVGGAERMLLNLSRGLDTTRHRVRVVSMYPAAGTAIEHDLKAASIEVVFLKKHLGFDRSMFGAIRRTIQAFRPHVVHTHRAAIQYALPGIVLARCVAVHTVHTQADREVPLIGRIAHRVAFRAGVAPVAISDAMAASFRAVYAREPADVIANGIPTEQFANAGMSRRAWRVAQGLSDEDVAFVCAARLAPPKNLPGLLRAFARAVPQVPAARLLLAGDGPLRSELISLAEDLRITHRVRFLGARSDMPEVLAASDVFVLASVWEGSPLSVMEAMAAKLPVIATAVGGIPQLLSDGVMGKLVPPNDEPALTRAIVELAKDKEQRQRIGTAACERARESFDVSVMTNRYVELYERLLASHA